MRMFLKLSVSTVTFTESLKVPPQAPVSTIVTVYVVVTVGLATGLEMLVALKPVEGLQLYDIPPLADRVVELPLHIATLELAPCPLIMNFPMKRFSSPEVTVESQK